MVWWQNSWTGIEEVPDPFSITANVLKKILTVIIPEDEKNVNLVIQAAIKYTSKSKIVWLIFIKQFSKVLEKFKNSEFLSTHF
jgi:hypothetical protein